VRELAKTPRRYRALTRSDLDSIAPLQRLPVAERIAMKAVAAVWPFRTNQYVVDELIDWHRVPDDPIFRLVFPQRGMLPESDLLRMVELVGAGADDRTIEAAAHQIRLAHNPHPAGQLAHNVPYLQGKPVQGVQHKYRETVLFFPAQGQTCHAYCAYCFRWPQFVGHDELRFATREAETLVAYLRAHPEVTNVLITGGDPMIMKTALLRRYVQPLLEADLPNLASIRFGSKAPAYWPHRFVGDEEADDLMRLFEQIVTSGHHLALMAHFSHPRELATPIAQQALRRIRATGAVVRCQAPIIRGVNDRASVWADLWRSEIRLGAIPYYMFVARDTGPRDHFAVPLARAFDVFRRAFSSVSGLARTVRGPSMSATPGKVVIDGVVDVAGEELFALRLLQARNPDWVGRPFYARFDPRATWLDQLQPAGGAERFFFDEPPPEAGRRTLRVVGPGGPFEEVA